MEEVELFPEKDNYEVIPVTPLRRLERRIQQLEQSSTIPQLQTLITQIIDLIKTNQKFVEDIIKANNELKEELAKIPKKIDELLDSINEILKLVKAAGEEEIKFSPEALKPIVEQFQKMVEQNQELVESNREILERIERLTKKVKAGTPVSKLLEMYPNLRLRKG